MRRLLKTIYGSKDLNSFRRFFSNVATIPPLKAQFDLYNGVTVCEDLTGMEANVFGERLTQSINIWKSDNKFGVWLRVPIELSALVPIAVKHGFWFHHCRSKYILLCYWLPGGKDCSQLPGGPLHYVGVAGFVINSKKDLLMIKEKSGPAAAAELWKLPGGLLDFGEDIATGTLREVKEETGIDCDFFRLAAIVESHRGTGPMRESSTDLYCTSVLTAIDENQTIIRQEKEIADCAWIPMEKVLSMPFYARNQAFGESLRAALTVYEERSSVNIGMYSKTFRVGTAGKRSANVLYIRDPSDDVDGK